MEDGPPIKNPPQTVSIAQGRNHPTRNPLKRSKLWVGESDNRSEWLVRVEQMGGDKTEHLHQIGQGVDSLAHRKLQGGFCIVCEHIQLLPGLRQLHQSGTVLPDRAASHQRAQLHPYATSGRIQLRHHQTVIVSSFIPQITQQASLTLPILHHSSAAFLCRRQKVPCQRGAVWRFVVFLMMI